MSRTNLKLVVAFCFILLLASCQKGVVDSGHNPPTSTDITDNTNTIFKGSSWTFIVCTITTSQNINQVNSCYPGTVTVNTFANTSNQPMTVGIASVFVPSPFVFFQGNGMSSCYTGYNLYGLSYSPVNLTAPTIWSMNSTSAVPIDTSYNDTVTPPVTPGIACADTISIHSSYTLHRSGVISSDSVVFVISGARNEVEYQIPQTPVTDSVTFSASQMASLGVTPFANLQTGANAGLVQIMTYKIHSDTFFNHQCCFVKEACYSKYVVLK